MKTQQQELCLGVRAADTEMYHAAGFIADLQGMLATGFIDDFRVYPDGSVPDGTFTCWVTFADSKMQEWRTSDGFELDQMSMQVKVEAAAHMQSWCPLEGDWTGIDAASRQALRAYIRENWQPLASYAYESFLAEGQGSMHFLFDAPGSRTVIGRDCFYLRAPDTSPKASGNHGWPRTFDPVKQVVFSVYRANRARYIVASPADRDLWPETIWTAFTCRQCGAQLVKLDVDKAGNIRARNVAGKA